MKTCVQNIIAMLGKVYHLHSKIKRGVIFYKQYIKKIVTRVFSFLSPIYPCMISLIVVKKKKIWKKKKAKKNQNDFT